MSVATLSETRVQDRILTVTRDAELPGLTDQAFTHSALAAFLFGKAPGNLGKTPRERSRGPRMQGGGATIEHRVNLGKNTAAKRSTSHWAAVDNTPSDTRRWLRDVWRFYDVAVNISDHELRVNRGGQKIIDLVTAETSLALDSLADIMMDDVLAISSAATAMNSMRDVTSDTVTLHGVAPGTYTFWASRGLDGRTTATGGRDFASGSFQNQGLADMRLLVNNATEGGVRPDALFNGWTTMNYFEAELAPQERFMDSDLASAGFVNLSFKGIPVFPDSKMDENDPASMLALNFDNVFVIALEGSNLDTEPFHPSERQKASTAKIHFTGNLLSSRRWAQNRMSSITA